MKRLTPFPVRQVRAVQVIAPGRPSGSIRKTRLQAWRKLRRVGSCVCFMLFGALLLVLLCTGSVQAVTLVGGDPPHNGAVLSVLDSRPNLLAYVESRWPDLYVRVWYGGHAWPGYFDVDRSRWGKEFTDQVAHEFCHMIQLNNGPLGDAWLAELTRRGYGPETWIWGQWPPYYGKRDPWEAFAENVKRAYYSPYYTLTTTPDTQLVWLSRADMTTFLIENGVQP